MDLSLGVFVVDAHCISYLGFNYSASSSFFESFLSTWLLILIHVHASIYL